MNNIKKIININLYKYLGYNSNARINYDKYFIHVFATLFLKIDFYAKLT